MSITKLHLIYFSPGGTTEKTVRTIASGIDGIDVAAIDLLPSGNRKKRYVFGPDDLVVFGCMTAQKLFTLSDEIFACLEGHGTPFIGVITYGNGFYGIALTEMLRRARSSGFKVAALGALQDNRPSRSESRRAVCTARCVQDKGDFGFVHTMRDMRPALPGRCNRYKDQDVQSRQMHRMLGLHKSLPEKSDSLDFKGDGGNHRSFRRRL